MDSLNQAQPKLIQVCLSRSWGGLEMAAFELAHELHSRGIFMRTVCPEESRLTEKLQAYGLPYLKIEARKYFDLNAITKIRKAVIKDKATCVVLQQLRDIWHVSPALKGSLKKIPLVGFGHIFLSHAKRDVFHRWLYSRVETIICLTDTQKQNFLKHLPVRADQITVIPNGVDTLKFSPTKRSEAIRQSLGIEGDEIAIGLIGRLDPMKGQIETVEAAKILKERGIQSRIVLVGEDTLNTGGTRAKLEAMIAEFNLEKMVSLAGFRKDIPEVIASVDILAMPSWAETFGRVLIEAMACETPVVSTAAGGVVDIIENNVDGILVPPKDAFKLAQAFEKLILDADLRARLKQSAKTKVELKYDLSKVQTALDSVLLRNPNA